MPGDDGVGDAGEPAGAEVHVRAAHLAQFDFQQGGAGLQLRLGELVELDGRSGRWEDGGGDGVHSRPLSVYAADVVGETGAE